MTARDKATSERAWAAAMSRDLETIGGRTFADLLARTHPTCTCDGAGVCAHCLLRDAYRIGQIDGAMRVQIAKRLVEVQSRNPRTPARAAVCDLPDDVIGLPGTEVRAWLTEHGHNVDGITTRELGDAVRDERKQRKARESR